MAYSMRAREAISFVVLDSHAGILYGTVEYDQRATAFGKPENGAAHFSCPPMQAGKYWRQEEGAAEVGDPEGVMGTGAARVGDAEGVKEVAIAVTMNVVNMMRVV